MVLCEKPLARDLKEAAPMVEAIEKAGVPNTVWYNYRRVPAVTLAKKLIDEGRLGRIFHYRANFLQDWTISADLPQGGAGLWRLDAASAGSGVTGDLLAHCIDTALWLNGSIANVCATTETFVKERKHNVSGKVEPVKIDDACAFLCRFANGSLGSVRIDPIRAGPQGPLHVRDQRREGLDQVGPPRPASAGLLRLQRDDQTLRGWRSIHVTDGDHPYMKQWWVPGLQIGYEHTFVHQVADFIKKPRRPAPPPARPSARRSRRRRSATPCSTRPIVGKWEARCLRSDIHRPRGRDRPSRRPCGDLTDEDRHEPAALDRPRHGRARRPCSTSIKGLGFDAVEIPIFNTADIAGYERLGGRLRSLGLGATGVTVMGPGDQPDLARPGDPGGGRGAP